MALDNGEDDPRALPDTEQLWRPHLEQNNLYNQLDFTKPVGIRHNSTQLSGQMKVQPSLQTLVEEFLYHWDRQRLFFAKIELKL